MQNAEKTGRDGSFETTGDAGRNEVGMQNAECRMQEGDGSFEMAVTHSAFCILHSEFLQRW
jgi:hypothetical protein